MELLIYDFYPNTYMPADYLNTWAKNPLSPYPCTNQQLHVGKMLEAGDRTPQKG